MDFLPINCLELPQTSRLSVGDNPALSRQEVGWRVMGFSVPFFLGGGGEGDLLRLYDNNPLSHAENKASHGPKWCPFSNDRNFVVFYCNWMWFSIQ